MGGGGELHASLLVELHKDCLNEKMRDDKVIRAHKGREFAKGKKWRGSFFRNLGVWGGGVGAADRKPLMILRKGVMCITVRKGC